MNFEQYIPTATDPEWIDRYIDSMGEDAFWQYVDKMYKLLDGLEVRQSIAIEQWVKPESYDLFIKIAYCYITTSECCYQFNPEYTIIKRQFNAREMENTLALLARKRKEQESGGDGTGAESRKERIEAILTPEPVI
jgi:hypothetical protein